MNVEKITLDTTRQLLELPHLSTERQATDLMPLADDLRRMLRVDRLWIGNIAPSGMVLAEATADGITEHDRRPDGLAWVDRLTSAEGPTRIERKVLPHGWRAGVHLSLRAPDGRPAGWLLLGWTRLSGWYEALRVSSGKLGMTLTSMGQALGAFWANNLTARELERESARLSAVIDHSDAAILALDASGRIAVWNTAMADLTGLTAGNALGRRTEDLFTLTDEEGSAVRLADRMHRGAMLTTATGRTLWVEISSSALADTALTAVFVDKSATRQLEHMRNLALASIHHELHGPLTMIHGHAQLLETAVPEEGTKGSLEAIVDAVEMMHDVIGELVRLDGDPLDGAAARAEPIDVAALLRRTLLSVPAAASRTVIAPRSGVTVYGDPVRLRECVLLILDNAEKYAPHGKITLTMTDDGVIGIEDEGPGIPAAERHLALIPYVRLPATLDRPGSGLGLYIAEMMMTGMHGRLELSDAPSGGLKVSLRLPLSPPEQG